MSEKINRAHQQTFDQGHLRAMEMAIATFLRMQQDVPLELFKAVYAENTATWADTTLAMDVTDEYRHGAAFGSRALLSLLPTSDRDQSAQ